MIIQESKDDVLSIRYPDNYTIFRQSWPTIEHFVYGGLISNYIQIEILKSTPVEGVRDFAYSLFDEKIKQQFENVTKNALRNIIDNNIKLRQDIIFWVGNQNVITTNEESPEGKFLKLYVEAFNQIKDEYIKDYHISSVINKKKKMMNDLTLIHNVYRALKQVDNIEVLRGANYETILQKGFPREEGVNLEVLLKDITPLFDSNTIPDIVYGEYFNPDTIIDAMIHEAIVEKSQSAIVLNDFIRNTVRVKYPNLTEKEQDMAIVQLYSSITPEQWDVCKNSIESKTERIESKKTLFRDEFIEWMNTPEQPIPEGVITASKLFETLQILHPFNLTPIIENGKEFSSPAMFIFQRVCEYNEMTCKFTMPASIPREFQLQKHKKIEEIVSTRINQGLKLKLRDYRRAVPIDEEIRYNSEDRILAMYVGKFYSELRGKLSKQTVREIIDTDTRYQKLRGLTGLALTNNPMYHRIVSKISTQEDGLWVLANIPWSYNRMDDIVRTLAMIRKYYPVKMLDLITKLYSTCDFEIEKLKIQIQEIGNKLKEYNNNIGLLSKDMKIPVPVLRLLNRGMKLKILSPDNEVGIKMDEISNRYRVRLTRTDKDLLWEHIKLLNAFIPDNFTFEKSDIEKMREDSVTWDSPIVKKAIEKISGFVRTLGIDENSINGISIYILDNTLVNEYQVNEYQDNNLKVVANRSFFFSRPTLSVREELRGEKIMALFRDVNTFSDKEVIEKMTDEQFRELELALEEEPQQEPQEEPQDEEPQDEEQVEIDY